MAEGDEGGKTSRGSARYTSFCDTLDSFRDTIQKEILRSRKEPPLPHTLRFDETKTAGGLPVKGNSRGHSSSS